MLQQQTGHATWEKDYQWQTTGDDNPFQTGKRVALSLIHQEI